jgi:hypothetical protein
MILVAGTGRSVRGDRIVFRRRTPRAEGQPRFGDRRKAKRRSANWESRYRVVDEEREHLHYAGDDFEPCTLTDLSMEGAGLHLEHGEITVGDCIELDVPLGAQRRASIQVRGEVRYATFDDGPARAGLEFVDVGDLERALLLRLLRDMDTTATQSA